MGGHYGEDGELSAPCSPPPELSGKWYATYDTSDGEAQCVQECDGAEDRCGGRASSFQHLYKTFNACCEHHLFWSTDCEAYDANGNAGEGLGEPTNKYFVDYQSGSCLQDCEPGPFGCAQVPPPIVLYDDIDTCCTIGQSWVDYEYCTSRSIDSYSDGWVVDFSNEKCGESSCANHLIVFTHCFLTFALHNSQGLQSCGRTTLL